MMERHLLRYELREAGGQQSRVQFSWDFLAAEDRSNRLNYIPNVCIERSEHGLKNLITHHFHNVEHT